MEAVRAQQLLLGDLIDFLRTRLSAEVVPFRDEINSYRGYYSEVGLEPGSCTAGRLADYLESMIGDTMRGYKGGDYEIRTDCRVYVAYYGETGPALALSEDKTKFLLVDTW